MVYTDEFLDYWAGVYCRAQLAEHKLPFSAFVRDPWWWIQQFGIKEPELSGVQDIKPPRDPQAPSIKSGGYRALPRHMTAEVYDLAAARRRRQVGATQKEGGRDA